MNGPSRISPGSLGRGKDMRPTDRRRPLFSVLAVLILAAALLWLTT